MRNEVQGSLAKYAGCKSNTVAGAPEESPFEEVVDGVGAQRGGGRSLTTYASSIRQLKVVMKIG